MKTKIYKVTIALEDDENGYCPSEDSHNVLATNAQEAAEKAITKLRKEFKEPEGYFVDGVENIGVLDE